MSYRKTFLFLVLIIFSSQLFSQHSVARQWNEELLNAIRNDEGRPTVHTRNLFHISATMYDAWAVYDRIAEPLLLGKSIGEYTCEFQGVEIPTDSAMLYDMREEAISYGAYRLLKHRFAASPGAEITTAAIDAKMLELGYDTSFVSTDYSDGNPAALGNFIALSYMELGLVDYSNEVDNFEHSDSFYLPVNPAMQPNMEGNPNIVDLNHWQPLSFSENTSRRFLNPHWGDVTPFALTEDDLTVYQKMGNDYNVFYDPGPPPFIDSSGTIGLDDYYKWNFALVAVWSGQLDPSQDVFIDISPASVGNVSELPQNQTEMQTFYKFMEGGVEEPGYDVNPSTGQPYEEQLVRRGDFGRVLAEFWADGPNSETPPGHWFTILNYVNDHPEVKKQFKGEGEVLSDLEWDVKSYLALGGAVHDVAIAVWGMKSYYDYIRPVSAIRGMAEFGQSSDTSEMSYHPAGLPLIEGHIELVKVDDALAGENNENVGKVKLYAWRGPDHIEDENQSAGVGWILAANWWPYQQVSFVTPPFAGYVSGHSTFSRAAAEVLALVTGDEYFPGGMGVFEAKENEFLYFENGPTTDMELQWAKYADASDQASLSRLWGGIHPPVDDVPGRLIGKQIGPKAFYFAEELFNGNTTSINNSNKLEDITVMRNFPNPAATSTQFIYSVKNTSESVSIEIYNFNGQRVDVLKMGEKHPGLFSYDYNVPNEFTNGLYFYRLKLENQYSKPHKLLIAK